MGTGTAATIAALSIMLIFLSYSAISSYFYGKKLKGATVTRGISGTSGQTVNLQCSPGQVISFSNPNPSTSRAVLLVPEAAGTVCDPFFTPSVGQSVNFFNQNATLDLLASGSPFTLAGCAGNNSCVFTVPSPTDSNLVGSQCLSQAASISLIGTYDCVYQG